VTLLNEYDEVIPSGLSSGEIFVKYRRDEKGWFIIRKKDKTWIFGARRFPELVDARNWAFFHYNSQFLRDGDNDEESL
jgi:hypothetical protein